MALSSVLLRFSSLVPHVLVGLSGMSSAVVVWDMWSNSLQSLTNVHYTEQVLHHA